MAGMQASMATTPQGANVADQLQAQIVALQDVVTALQQSLGDAEDDIRRNGSRGVGSRGAGGGHDDELVSRKFFDPDPFTSKDVGREWSEDFVDFISSHPHGEQLGSNLEQARVRKEPYDSIGSTPEQIKASRTLYRLLKK